jgi:hypothetical protein
MEDSAAFCGACGAKAEEAAPVAAPAVTPVVTEAPKARRNVKSMVFSIIGLVLGGVSLFWALLCLLLCWLPAVGMVYPLVGFIYAVPGIIFANLSKADADRGRAKAGKIMNLVAMIAFGVTFLIGIIALAGGASGQIPFFSELFEELFKS